MKAWLRSISVRKAAFFLCIALAFTPFAAFHFISGYFHTLRGGMAVEDGVLDVSRCDLTQSAGYPLDGTWEFYNDVLLSAAEERPEADLMAKVPLPWSQYGRYYGWTHKAAGVCSYRAVLQNCPGGVPLTVYIPNISSAYRVYFNGVLVSARSEQAFEDVAAQDASGWGLYNEFREGLVVPEGSTAEVVVELDGRYIGGMYVTPVLVNAELDARRTELRRFVVSAYIGMLVLCISGFCVLQLLKASTVPSAALLFMDLLVLARIFIMDEFYQITRLVLPAMRQYTTSVYLQALTLFLPLAFMFSIRLLVQQAVSRKVLLFTAVYELLFAVSILISGLAGYPLVMHYLCRVSYLPFIYVLLCLYRSVAKGARYAVTISAILLLSMASIMGADLKASGLLVINISLFAPTCFLLAVLLQLTMNLRRSRELQHRAMEAEALAFQLKESRITLMLSQIRPHFLYNTLVAIHMLCLRSPADAAEAILTFSDYLRANMRSISSDKLIPFAQELSHIDNYVAIEKLRFEERLTFRKEIVEDAFLIPPLTIQPLVENAIKHGACKNVDGGTVVLRAYGTERWWRVEVSDDGPGFDTELLRDVQRDSVGLSNIIFRLRERLGAEVDIQSRLDQGTLVVVSIPKEAGHESDPG